MNYGILLLIPPCAVLGALLGFALHWVVTYPMRMRRQRIEALYNRIINAPVKVPVKYWT